MVIYVAGGSGSGKSAFAESLITNCDADKRTYIATMQIWDDEGKKRVQRHRSQRADKGFDTIECPLALEKISPSGGAVLLEDLTNLFTNEWYSLERETAVQRVSRALQRLAEKSELLVIVGNDIFSDGCDYGEDLREYLFALGELNRFAAGLAGQVYELVCGVPILHEQGKFGGGEAMTLIIGGANQGKLEYAKSALNCGGVATNPAQAVHCEIFCSLDSWLKTANSPYEELEALLEKNPNIVIICNEVGCGVVPLGEGEREWRERVGRVCTWLARRALRVMRVYCGIPTVLKGDTL